MLDEISGDIEKSDVDSFGVSIVNKQLYQEFADRIFKDELYIVKGHCCVKVMNYFQYHFKEKYGYYFDGDTEILLDFAKRRMLAMIFAPSNMYIFEQVVFESMFPKVLKFINEFKNVKQYKEDKSTTIANRDKHKKMSHLGFQFEAKVMINIMAREFDKLHKGRVAIFTLHDCLLVPERYGYELKEFMHNKFLELFGVAPNLTLEISPLSDEYNIAS